MSLVTALHRDRDGWITIGEVRHPSRPGNPRMMLMRHETTGIYRCDDLGVIVSVDQRWAHDRHQQVARQAATDTRALDGQ